MTDDDMLDRARIAVIDALRPLFGAPGIVATHTVIYVMATDGLLPVACSLAMTNDLMVTTFAPAAEYMTWAAEQGHDGMYAVPVPVKN